MKALQLLIVLLVPGMGFGAAGRLWSGLASIWTWSGLTAFASWSWAMTSIGGWLIAALAAWVCVQPACMAIESRLQRRSARHG